MAKTKKKEKKKKPIVKVEADEGNEGKKGQRILLKVELPSDMYTVRITKLKDKPSVPDYDCAVVKEECFTIPPKSEYFDTEPGVVKVERLSVAPSHDCEIIKVETPETNILEISDDEEDMTSNAGPSCDSQASNRQEEIKNTPRVDAMEEMHSSSESDMSSESDEASKLLPNLNKHRQFKKGGEFIKMRVPKAKHVNRTESSMQRRPPQVRIRHPPRQNVTYRQVSDTDTSYTTSEDEASTPGDKCPTEFTYVVDRKGSQHIPEITRLDKHIRNTHPTHSFTNTHQTVADISLPRNKCQTVFTYENYEKYSNRMPMNTNPDTYIRTKHRTPASKTMNQTVSSSSNTSPSHSDGKVFHKQKTCKLQHSPLEPTHTDTQHLVRKQKVYTARTASTQTSKVSNQDKSRKNSASKKDVKKLSLSKCDADTSTGGQKVISASCNTDTSTNNCSYDSNLKRTELSNVVVKSEFSKSSRQSPSLMPDSSTDPESWLYDQFDPNKTCEEIAVPSNLVGLVIGKNGWQIHKLMAEYQCKIQFDDEETQQQERPDGVNICKISGKQDNVRSCKRRIKRILHPSEKKNFTLHQSYVSQLIGLKGATINKIRQETGARIFFNRDPSDKSQHHCCMIGEKKQILAATTLMQNIIGDSWTIPVSADDKSLTSTNCPDKLHNLNQSDDMLRVKTEPKDDGLYIDWGIKEEPEDPPKKKPRTSATHS